MAFPLDPDRLDYTVTPFEDANGKKWTWNQSLLSWQPYLDAAPQDHTHVLADVTDAGTAAAAAVEDFEPALTAASQVEMETGTEAALRSMSPLRIKQAVTAHAPAWDGDIADINLDGGTDIGADLADADLILVDDGAGGTNRKSAISRVWTYIKAKIDAGQTWAGAHAFSSTTRPTSAGTGNPASDSLITLSDSDTRFVREYLRGLYQWSKAITNYSATHVLTGSASTNTDVLDLSSGSTAGGTSFLRSNIFLIRPWHKSSGSTRSIVNWSLRTSFFTRLQPINVSGADTVFRVILGQPYTNTTAQDLSNSEKGIGFKIIAGLVYAHYSNGTTSTSTSTGVTLSATTDNDLIFESDGAGNWQCFINGNSAGSGTGAPTGNSATGSNALCLSMTNGTTAAARQVYVVDMKTIQI